MQETQFNPWVRKISWRKQQPNSSILSWKIPWTEDPTELQSMWSQRVGQLSNPYSWSRRFNFIKMSIPWREQDGGGVGGYAVHLSTWIHQEYTFRHRSACRTPAESGQEYLTSGKEYTESCKTQQDKGTRGGET